MAFVAWESMATKPIQLKQSYPSMELHVADCTTTRGRLNTVVIHRPLRPDGFFDEFYDLYEEVITLPGRLLICGDLNCLPLT